MNEVESPSSTKWSNFLPEFVYGGIDGSVTTFAVVAGASGAELAASIVIILGFANLIADGLSMSIGNYLATKSEKEEYQKIYNKEAASIEAAPELKEQEMKRIFGNMDYEGEVLDTIVKKVTSNKERWLTTLMKEKWEMIPSGKSPVHTALITFVSFILIGLVPLMIYLADYWWEIPSEQLFPIACLLTAAAFIFIGYLKSRVNHTSIFRGIVETLLLGSIAAGVAYFVGDILEKWVL